MSKIKLPLRRYNLVLALLTLILSTTVKGNEGSENFIGSFSQDEIKQRLDDLNADVDLRLTSEVKKYLRDYVVSYRQSSEKLLGRSLIYFPAIENKISEKQLPDEIKYLSVIESSLRPDARSRVGAVGLWQFMKSTAKMYGLEIDRQVDERKDVAKSTDAALDYLRDLNERFGDWTLALAAYNCGPGNVRKAMRRSGGKDYWSIRNYLPRETRNYVPKFIAVTYVMTYFKDHDLSPAYPDQLFIKTRKAVIYEQTSLASIIEHTGMSIDEIRSYNPSFIGTHIPKSKEGKVLELPSEMMYTYLANTEHEATLMADPLQDLAMETQVAAQKIEKREAIEAVPLITRELSNYNIEYTREPKSEVKKEAQKKAYDLRSKVLKRREDVPEEALRATADRKRKTVIKDRIKKIFNL
ncbi:lytic transglycosylase domain-containing protein [Portibacter marinus]|uniref:lytic transglycosylase domain-containing protein n=1 Tax=Portibacter marinus TaxID=2898660 RepID=UPI001F2D5C13|nr:lytic transglycosylase domain-containing protein [Portibacter marinus]